MTVGLEMAAARWVRGPGRYARLLAESLLHRGDPWRYALVTPVDLAGTIPGIERAAQMLAPPRHGGAFLSGAVFGAAKHARLDLVHFTFNDFWLRRPARVKAVATVHDLAVETFPERFQTTLKEWAVWAVKRRRAGIVLDRIVADSAFTAGQLRDRWGWPEERISVVPLAASPLFSPGPSTGGGRPYFLYVGGFDFRKNLPGLVEAFRIVVGRGLDADLVLAGGMGKDPRIYPPLSIPAGLRDRVRIVDGPDDDALVSLYRGALALVHPSTYEGFGLTVLEAMACGTPVACSTAASLPEVAGDAALPFDPLSVEEIAGAMTRLAEDGTLRAELIRRGMARAAGFTWERTAELTAGIYRRLLGIG